MKPFLAIVGLTWKAAFRYRLFWVLTVLLITSVVVLPLVLVDDGTAQGLTQILLTYTLSSITALLGFSTLWLACGILARDIEDAQMQVVCVKPIPRWQIWLGKWVGIVSLNAALLGISGASVYAMLMVRAARLAPEQQAILKSEIFVARASAKPPVPNLAPELQARFAEITKTTTIPAESVEKVRQKIIEDILADKQNVPPMTTHRWVVDLSAVKDQLRGKPLRARVKFHGSSIRTGAIYSTLWQVGPPETAKVAQIGPISFPGDSFQEFEIPPNLYDDSGKLTIEFGNINNETIYFGLDDGMEVLYPEGTFGVNYIRGLAIILFWMALLASIGLAAASWLSFPVASFFSLAILILGLSSGTISSAVESESIMGFDHETGKPNHPLIDSMAIPFFKAALALIKLAQNFSPIDALSTGRSITWTVLAIAGTQIVLIMAGFFALLGMILFSKRELASAQSNS